MKKGLPQASTLKVTSFSGAYFNGSAQMTIHLNCSAASTWSLI